MKRTAIAILLLLCGLAAGYGGSFSNLLAPTYDVATGDIELSVDHRFFGAAFKDDPLDSFFGLDDGANVGISARYFAANEFYFGYTHKRLGHVHTLLGGWQNLLPLRNIELAALAGYKSVKFSAENDREGGMIATGSISAWFLNGKFRPVFNYSFDGYQDENGMGFGLELTASENLSLLGEFFPAADEAAAEDCFSFGCRYTTWGHQFYLGMSNSFGIGARDMIMGSPNGDLSVSMGIKRLL